MNVSFAWTTEAFLNGTKRETRRFWKDHYAVRFKAGQVHTAIDKDFRAGGKKVGKFIVTADPFKQPLSEMSEESFWLEGGRQYWDTREDYINAMGGPDKVPWVLQFNPCDSDGIPIPDDHTRYFNEPWLEDWLFNFGKSSQALMAYRILAMIKKGKEDCRQLMMMSRPERKLEYLKAHNASVKYPLAGILLTDCRLLTAHSERIQKCSFCNRHFLMPDHSICHHCKSCHSEKENYAGK